jgi:RNA polymerase sigma factor (sigma-70 family)
MSAAAPVDPAEHQGLVWMVVRRYLRLIEGTMLAPEDLVNEGNFGLMRAAETYDPEKAKFSTYAAGWIRHYVGRAIQNQLRTVRVPTHKQARGGFKYHPRFNVPLMVSSGRGSTASEKKTEDEVCIVDLMQDRFEPASSAADGAEQQEMSAILRAGMLERLDHRERKILKRMFWEEATLQDVGDELGLSRERVRQIKNSALEKLRLRAERARNG